MSSERPRFPVRLAPTVSVATRARPAVAPISPVVQGTPAMASDAVRARMVQRLAAQGIADARVLR
ncbi:MAG TPA: protein-L-isoaspartate O-methyltransferase, partial [Variovorax sp.]